MIQKSGTDQAKAVTEMTQHVRETTKNLAMILVVCQFSRGVIGYEDS